MNDDDEDTTKTTVKTLWTETILEILYESLRNNGSDAKIREILVEVRGKGYKPGDIVDRVRRKVDTSAAARVKSLMSRK